MDLLAHLAAFVAVAERRSFSTAAEQLHVAQPLLSRRIKNLERRLGGALFERSQRHVEITELGRLLLPHAEDIIGRTQHLLALADSTPRTTSITVGIPPDSEPSSLARLLKEAVQHEALITAQELPARQRASAVEEGRLGWALLRVPVDDAAFVVALGLATLPDPTAAGGPVHLDSLRPRRRAARHDSMRLLVLPEDDIAEHIDRLGRALAAAGLNERCLTAVSSPSTAVAEVLAGTGQLICDERFAHRHDLAWRRLADPSLHRGYELAADAGGIHGPSLDALRVWLLPVLAEATGAGPTAPRSTAPTAGDDRSRLAAGV